MLLPVFDAWSVRLPLPLALAKASLPSSPRKYWYFLPSAWTPFSWKPSNFFDLKQAAMAAASWGDSFKA